MEESEGTVTLTREQLYDLVWTTPIRALAKAYEISDVGLRKQCTRMRVPVPYRGYWQQLRNGKRARKLPLRAPATVGLLPESTVLRLRLPEKAGPPRPKTEFDRLVDAELDPKNKIAARRVVRTFHPITIRAKERAPGQRYSGLCRIVPAAGILLKVSFQSLERALRILESLIRGLDGRGFLKKERGEYRIEIRGERVEFAIAEFTVRPDREKEHISRYEYVPNGRLRIRAGNSDAREFADSDRLRVEDRLNEVVIRLVRLAESRCRSRIEWAEWKRLRDEEEQVRLDRQRTLQLRGKLVQDLEHSADNWIRARRLERYAKAVREKAAQRGTLMDEDNDTTRWLSWVERRIADVDPLAEGKPLPGLSADLDW